MRDAATAYAVLALTNDAQAKANDLARQNHQPEFLQSSGKQAQGLAKIQ